jgi:hypothetical protein
MSLDLTSFDSALKSYYTDDRVQNMTYMENPLFALLPKMEQFGGKNLPIPLIYGNPQGRSRTFSNAQTRGAATSSKLEDFVLTRVKDYSIATIDNETLEASKGDKSAFLEAATTEIDGAIRELTNSVALNQYGSGFGDRGVISAINTNEITLTSPGDITNFEVGMIVEAAASNTAAMRTGSTEVTAVDRSNGTFTLASAAAITGLAVGDLFYVQGDRNTGASPAKSMISGLQAWVPQTAPTGGDNFFGVDRSVDVTRLAGYRLAVGSLPIEEALIAGEALVGRGGFSIDHYFISHDRFADLKKALGSKVQYVDMQATAKVSFRGVTVDGTKNTIRVLPDRNCPDNKGYGIKLGMFKMYSLGKCVRVIDTDGLQMLRQASADGVECRYGFYGNMACRGPGYAVALDFS